ncbi:hypothetical protein BT96DRAFT_1023921 [Gymnopus androsaceus JB14]|uniref:Uncharacterized protein n=1 Tax=Gymnopus androsaceus JB14 TaxID=1447944 RepID=A0A6A4H272_9AGAR|nr:hypothetical protein BT96DRAFT_1023921 [Gymnopus androsaceus JB14]
MESLESLPSVAVERKLKDQGLSAQALMSQSLNLRLKRHPYINSLDISASAVHRKNQTAWLSSQGVEAIAFCGVQLCLYHVEELKSWTFEDIQSFIRDLYCEDSSLRLDVNDPGLQRSVEIDTVCKYQSQSKIPSRGRCLNKKALNQEAADSDSLSVRKSLLAIHEELKNSNRISVRVGQTLPRRITHPSPSCLPLQLEHPQLNLLPKIRLTHFPALSRQHMNHLSRNYSVIIEGVDKSAKELLGYCGYRFGTARARASVWLWSRHGFGYNPRL